MNIRPISEHAADPFESDIVESLRVLLVEDDQELAGSLSTVLEFGGFRVARAINGAAALAAARQAGVDAVVLDRKLPDIDGLEVCRRLRHAPETSDLVIVMLTGLDDPRARAQAFDIGADDYLVKPVSARELGSRLRQLYLNRAERETDLLDDRRQAVADPTALYHTINTPLTAALGSLSLTLATEELSADVRHDLDECLRHLHRIGRLLRRLDGADPDASGPTIARRFD